MKRLRGNSLRERERSGLGSVATAECPNTKKGSIAIEYGHSFGSDSAKDVQRSDKKRALRTPFCERVSMVVTPRGPTGRESNLLPGDDFGAK